MQFGLDVMRDVCISRYTAETLNTNVAELNTRLKTIASRVEQAADVQLQREFHGFLEVSVLPDLA